MKTLEFLLKSALSVLLMLSGLPAGYGQSSDPAGDPLKKLAGVVDFLKDMQRLLDKRHFDLDALSENLDFDADTIVAFVKENIAFQQYVGLLRGPKGTLVSGAGNSLDQSVLLAKLLKDAGYDARVARGVLSSDQAEQLLQNIADSRQLEEPFSDLEKVASVVNSHSQKLGFDPAPILESLSPDNMKDDLYREFVGTTDAQQEFLLGKLDGRDTASSGKEQYEALVSEARDYFWVEYSSGEGQPWVQLHPALAAGEFETLKAEHYLKDEVPPELQHRFAFEVIATQGGLGKDTEHVIMPRWERPAANLGDVHLTFNLHSRHLAGQLDRGEKLTAPPDANDVLTPMFNGKPVGTAINLYGTPIDLMAAGSAYAGIFEQIQAKTHKAVSALSGMDAKEDKPPANPMFLKGVRLDVYLTSPGGEVTRYSRPLFVDDGSGFTDPKTRTAQFERLTRIQDLGVLTGLENRTYVASKSLATLISNFDYLMLYARALRGEKLGELARSAPPGQPWKWAGLDLMSSLFDGVPRERRQVLYRPEPNVFLHSRSIGVGDKLIESLDVINNARRGIDVAERSVDVDLLIRSGVWDTLVEGALIGGPDSSHYGAIDLFEKAEKAGIDSLTITPADSSALGDLQMSEFARTTLLGELQQGYTIVIPSRTPYSDQEIVGWWRVNTETGETLGMMVKGTQYGGIELTEETILLIVAITGLIVIVGGIFSYISCPEGDGACKFCNGVQIALGAAGIIASLNVVAGLVVGLVAAILGAICAIGSFLNWERPGVAPNLGQTTRRGQRAGGISCTGSAGNLIALGLVPEGHLARFADRFIAGDGRQHPA